MSKVTVIRTSRHRSVTHCSADAPFVTAAHRRRAFVQSCGQRVGNRVNRTRAIDAAGVEAEDTRPFTSRWAVVSVPLSTNDYPLTTCPVEVSAVSNLRQQAIRAIATTKHALNRVDFKHVHVKDLFGKNVFNEEVQ